jgi:biopolymer transport protein ExbB
MLGAAALAAGRALAQNAPASAPAAPAGAATVAPTAATASSAAPSALPPAPAQATPADTELRRTNPFSLLMRPDTLTDFVFWTILLCSIIGVTLIIQGFIKVRGDALLPQSTTNRIREMIGSRQFNELMDFTERDPSFVSRALAPALRRAPNLAAMKEAMETAVAEQTAEQFRRIEYLNIIGNLGPLLGLLGTVFGMIDAFQAVNRTGGQANAAQLSGGISLALTHTMLGLMLAIPCLAAFGVLRTMVDRVTVRGALTAEELLLMLVKPVETKGAQIGARPVVGASPAAISEGGIGRRPVVDTSGA